MLRFSWTMENCRIGTEWSLLLLHVWKVLLYILCMCCKCVIYCVYFKLFCVLLMCVDMICETFLQGHSKWLKTFQKIIIIKVIEESNKFLWEVLGNCQRFVRWTFFFTAVTSRGCAEAMRGERGGLEMCPNVFYDLVFKMELWMQWCM